MFVFSSPPADIVMMMDSFSLLNLPPIVLPWSELEDPFWGQHWHIEVPAGLIGWTSWLFTYWIMEYWIFISSDWSYLLRLCIGKVWMTFMRGGSNLSKRELSFITRLYLVLPVPVHLFACFFLCVIKIVASRISRTTNAMIEMKFGILNLLYKRKRNKVKFTNLDILVKIRSYPLRDL